MNSRKIIIFGGSGYIGMNLANALVEKDYDVIIISRNAPKKLGAYTFIEWDAKKIDLWAKSLEGVDSIINLVGRSVDCVKNAENCDAILRSRVDSTELIGKALKELKISPRVWIQMSTAHIYGDSLDTHCIEASTTGYGFAPYIGMRWEDAYKKSVPKETRQVIVRTSFVLGKHAGALPRLSLLVKMGLGGRVGHGEQGVSWIHEKDMSSLLIYAIEQESMQGIYLATAPNPVSNDSFMRTLRKTIGIPFGLPAFSPMVKFGATYILKSDYELGLYGRYCSSSRLKDEKFMFEFPNIEEALKEIYQG